MRGLAICHCEERPSATKQSRSLYLLVACLLLLAGCGAPRTDRPGEIRYGSDVCAECRMIIGEKRFSAAAADTQGEILKFDDIGCMRMHESKAGAAPSSYWVHDHATEEWINGKDAFFVQADGLITPMGYGLAAFSTRTAADQFAQKQGGRLISWTGMTDVLKRINQSKGGNESEPNP